MNHIYFESWLYFCIHCSLLRLIIIATITYHEVGGSVEAVQLWLDPVGVVLYTRGVGATPGGVAGLVAH